MSGTALQGVNAGACGGGRGGGGRARGGGWIRPAGENAPHPAHPLAESHAHWGPGGKGFCWESWRAGGVCACAACPAAGVRGEKGRGGRSCCAGSRRRGRGCGVPGAEDGRHWSPREGKDPAPDRTAGGPAGRGTLRPFHPPPPPPDLNKAQARRSRAPLDPRSRWEPPAARTPHAGSSILATLRPELPIGTPLSTPGAPC